MVILSTSNRSGAKKLRGENKSVLFLFQVITKNDLDSGFCSLAASVHFFGFLEEAIFFVW